MAIVSEEIPQPKSEVAIRIDTQLLPSSCSHYADRQTMKPSRPGSRAAFARPGGHRSGGAGRVLACLGFSAKIQIAFIFASARAATLNVS
ncbi:hypothetical protein [Paenibacillus sp. UNC496MF]|uniref:hypothetical protein n=1 Tax=Paenibacillus sp. UNC496MF TaxID=1502753 RepID=UPI001160BB6C|nr:hypothetical protein [Paenibacillus sp. UNC496MF]